MLWRDPWAWLVALLVWPLLFAARGVPLGEPIADDLRFLYQSQLERRLDLLGGGGSPHYWRPLSRQIYYMLIGPFAVDHPGAVAALQAGLLAAAGVLLYRALRPAWPAYAAAGAGSFAVAIEAARELVTWSSCAQDLLALLFGTAMLHALSRGRPRMALAWLACALFSKETAIAFGVAMPLWPALVTRDGAPATSRGRLRLAAAAAAELALWWLLHEWASHRAGQIPPPRDGTVSAGMAARALWAVRGVFLDALSARNPGAPTSAWVPLVVLSILAIAALVGLGTRGGRARLHSALPWLGWAAVWSGLATAPLTAFMPFWSSHRAVIPAMGLGVALTALLQVLGPAGPGLVTALRLAALLASPRISERIGSAGSNVEFDFDRLGSLQRLAHEVRSVVLRAYPRLPHGARITRNQWPRMSMFAFEDPMAFRLWYRDTTLQVLGMGAVREHPLDRLDVAVEFEPHRTRQVGLITPRALKSVLLAADSLRSGRAAVAEALLRNFEHEQADTNAAVFMATAMSVRGGALLELRRDEEAAAALQRSLAYYPRDANAHRLLAEYHRLNGRPLQAMIELQRHLTLFPDDVEVRRALAEITGQRRP